MKIYGEQYRKNDFLLGGFQEDDLPFFVKINDLVVASTSIPIVAVDMYRTEGINCHIASYLIKRTNEQSLLLLSSLRYKNPLYPHSYGGDLYIILRSHTPNY